MEILHWRTTLADRFLFFVLKSLTHTLSHMSHVIPSIHDVENYAMHVEKKIW